LADRLDEGAGQLRAELATHREANAELEALRTLATLIRDLVLDNIDGSSSLVASLSMVIELLEHQINTTAANRVFWRTRSALVVAMWHFSELKSELELLRFRRNADLIEDQAESLWTRVRVASNSLASHVPSSVACSPPDGTGE
jgi:hypothetical protein